MSSLYRNEYLPQSFRLRNLLSPLSIPPHAPLLFMPFASLVPVHFTVVSEKMSLTTMKWTGTQASLLLAIMQKARLLFLHVNE